MTCRALFLHHKLAPEETGWPGRVVDGDRTEHTLRAFHRRWNELMQIADEDNFAAGGALR